MRNSTAKLRSARLLPNESSLLRLVSAIEMEINKDWVAGKRYLNMNVEMENENEYINSDKKKNYRKIPLKRCSALLKFITFWSDTAASIKYL